MSSIANDIRGKPGAASWDLLGVVAGELHVRGEVLPHSSNAARAYSWTEHAIDWAGHIKDIKEGWFGEKTGGSAGFSRGWTSSAGPRLIGPLFDPAFDDPTSEDWFKIRLLGSQWHPSYWPPHRGVDDDDGGWSGVGARETRDPHSRAGALDGANVGGVYLRGAGDSLKGLGALRGVALDKNGRLVLIAEDQGEIGLPPLRLDDVVLIFRRVYETGDNLYVSIDPDPMAPEGDHMNVRLDDKVRDSYVGWVLFQSDRVMKTYSLGADNESGEDIHTGIKDYVNLFSGAAPAAKADATWERFWIVPREVARRQSSAKELTLLDAPLQLKTQEMILKDGQLEPKPDGRPSAAAEAFCRWFTDHYDDLAREAKLTPPAESGATRPVAIFEELRRVALIAGVAETLRDRGRPLPAWMREYAVQPCPTPRTTPGRSFKRGNVRIYGGARLNPDSVRTVADDPAANALAPAVLQAVSAAPLMTPVRFEKDGKHYQAVALPGDDSLALGANHLEVTDLSVPIEGGMEISLTRHFHSFFSPTDVCGPAWTLDLPRLEKAKRPVEHNGDSMVLKPVYQLYTPLGSATAIFAEVGKVKDIGSLLVPETAGPCLGLLNEEDARSGGTATVFLRDGGKWRFNRDGDLVAVERPLFTTLYRRDKGRIVAIEGWYAGEKRASIDLSYDSSGRLTAARGGDGSRAEYEYGPDGVLSRAATPEGIVDYDYKNGLATGYAIRATHGDAAPIERRFEYNTAGRLLSERDGDGLVVHDIQVSPSGGAAILSQPGERRGVSPRVEESAQYDASLRPIRRTLADGTRLTWTYNKDGVEIAADLPSDGGRCVIRRRADDNAEEWTLPGGAQLGAGYDDAGRLTSLTRDGQPALERLWRGDGRLESIRLANTTQASVEYDPKTGAATGLFVSGPVVRGEQTRDWLQVKLDAHGNVVETKDAFGATATVGYDAAGRPMEATSKLGKVTLQRDDVGRVINMETSWGYRQKVVYGPDGPTRLEVGQGAQTAVVDFDNGRLRSIHDFDGGETRFTYTDKDGPPQAMRTPSGLTLAYEQGADKRLQGVTCGDQYRIAYEWDAKGRLVGWSLAPLKKGP
ncbi:MAG TPA: hypothetical protein VMS17_33630 [Gemmataceae bacterium]|nr:hypothetical protein [Gemmataceae bacterium]